MYLVQGERRKIHLLNFKSTRFLLKLLAFINFSPQTRCWKCHQVTGKGIPHPASCPGNVGYNTKLGGGGARRMSRQKAQTCRNLNKILAEQDLAAQQQVTLHVTPVNGHIFKCLGKGSTNYMANYPLFSG